MSGRDTKSAIRETAIRLIAAKGFEQTSLREVADEVGITKASLYYHYASKVDLLVAIVDPVLDEMRSVAAEIENLDHSPDNVRRVLSRYTTGLVRHRDEGILFVRDAVAIVNAIGDRYPAIIGLSQQLEIWLAGPAPSSEAQLRASAALQVLGVALTTNELVPEASDEEIERVLIGAAMSVLQLQPA